MAKSRGFALASRPDDPHNRSMRVRSEAYFGFLGMFPEGLGTRGRVLGSMVLLSSSFLMDLLGGSGKGDLWRTR